MIKCIEKQHFKSFEVLNRKFYTEKINQFQPISSNLKSSNFNRLETLCCKLICLMSFYIPSTGYVKDYATDYGAG